MVFLLFVFTSGEFMLLASFSFFFIVCFLIFFFVLQIKHLYFFLPVYCIRYDGEMKR